MKIKLDTTRNLLYAELAGQYPEDRYFEQVNMLSRKRGGVGFMFDKSGRETGVKNRWFLPVKMADRAMTLRKYCEGGAAEVVDALFEEVEKSRAADADVDYEAPEGLEYLPFQRAGVRYMLNKRATLLGDDMGLGKTIQVLGLVNNDPSVKKVLVVCPPTVRLNWLAEAKKWLTRDFAFQVVNGNQTVNPRATFVVVGWSNLAQKNVKPCLMNYNWDLVAFDEAHYGKNTREAKRAKVAYGYWDSKKRCEVEGVAHKAKRVVFMTGTPMPNRPKELFPMLRHLDPNGLGRGFITYARRYCEGHRGPYGYKADGATNLEELQRRLRSTCMVRRTKDQVLSELPSKVRSTIALDKSDVTGSSRLLARQKKLMESTGAAAALSDGDVEGAVELLRGSPEAFEEMAKIRAELGELKVPAVLELAKQALENNEKVIVFAHHRAVWNALREGLSSYGVTGILGGMSDVEKSAAVDTFQTDDSVRVFVGSIQACREGITLTKATAVVFAELPWRPGDVAQAEDRAHRIGQKASVNSYYVVMDESLDAYIANTVKEKAANIFKALDSDAASEEKTLSPEATLGSPESELEQDVEVPWSYLHLPMLPEKELDVAPF